MEYLFRLSLRGRKKTADAPPAQERADAASAGPMEGLTSAAELPSATASLAELFEDHAAAPADAHAARAGLLMFAAEPPSAAATLAEMFPEEIPPEGAVAASPTPQAAWEDAKTGDSSGDNTSENDASLKGGLESYASDVPALAALRDWAFEEKLSSHREWVDSKGSEGKKADFAGAKLDGAGADRSESAVCGHARCEFKGRGPAAGRPARCVPIARQSRRNVSGGDELRGGESGRRVARKRDGAYAAARSRERIFTRRRSPNRFRDSRPSVNSSARRRFLSGCSPRSRRSACSPA